MRTDIVIIGGGAVGAAVAYFVKLLDPATEVSVIERDPTYSLASTPRGSGGVRRLFSLPENIELSKFSIAFFEDFAETMAVDGVKADIGLKKHGYLFILPPSARDVLKRNFDTQQQLECNVTWLERDALKQMFPSMNVSDLGAAVYSPDDGWLVNRGVLMGLRNKAASMGATFLDDEVVRLVRQGTRVTTASLRSSRQIEASQFVNAAGAWAKEICAMLDICVPIEPLRRFEHYFEGPEPIEPLPYIKDTARLAFRPEGNGYSGGVPTLQEPRGYNFDVDETMICNRGNPMDYDGWVELGLLDWDYAHCLPYFRKMETFADGPSEWRGGDGPMHISRCRAEHKLYDAFLRGGEQAGFVVTPDHNGYQQEGLHVAQAFIHQGRRWSAARAYLYPAITRPNLQVMQNTLVERVVIDHGAAVGIAIAEQGGRRVITCEREVIVCAGALNTPKLLMLSGVGDPDELRRHGIAVVADVRGVGRNLQNHPGVDLQYTTNNADSLTATLSPLGQLKLGAEWLLRKQGLGTSNFFETGAFLRTRDDVAFPNMQYEFLPLTRQLKNGRLVPIPGFQFWMDLSRPGSRGAVTLRSANPVDPPSIVFNHLATRQDVQDLIDGVKLARTLIRQPAWDGYRGAEIIPGSDVASDREIEAFIRPRTGTSYHASCTCRMGADAEAVVDREARVKAVGCMRIVDASIMPQVITGNLNAPVMMMAEKLADCIRGKPALPPSDAPYYRATHSTM